MKGQTSESGLFFSGPPVTCNRINKSAFHAGTRFGLQSRPGAQHWDFPANRITASFTAHNTNILSMNLTQEHLHEKCDVRDKFPVRKNIWILRLVCLHFTKSSHFINKHWHPIKRGGAETLSVCNLSSPWPILGSGLQTARQPPSSCPSYFPDSFV